VVHDLANSEEIGQIFQKQMRNIGINISLTKLDYNSNIVRMVKGEAALFSMFFEFVFSSPEPLLINLFTTAKIPVPNFWQYSNKNIDKKLEELRYSSDRQESVAICADIEKEIMQDAPAVFLYRQKYIVMFSNKFRNLKVNAHNHYMFEELEMAE
jgi:ABC-type transport system substrate-binding protein